jgi:CRP/FNR family transcriptional regulator
MFYDTLVLARCPLFSGIPKSEYPALLAAARTKGYVRGDMVHMEGEPVQEVIMLTSGQMKITKLGGGGTISIVGLGVSGDVLGAAHLFSTGKHSTTAEALGQCRTIAWRASAFKAVVERSPLLYPNLIRYHIEYVRELEERFLEMSTQMVVPRVARQLVRLHEKLARPERDPVQIRISREELAQMTGTNRFSTSRLLAEWEARGLVRTCREGVTICDVQTLRELSESN